MSLLLRRPRASQLRRDPYGRRRERRPDYSAKKKLVADSAEDYLTRHGVPWKD